MYDQNRSRSKIQHLYRYEHHEWCFASSQSHGVIPFDIETEAIRSEPGE